MYVKTGMTKGKPQYNFVMGVDSGMPADPALLPIVTKLIIEGCAWQVTAIGRANIWALHARAAGRAVARRRRHLLMGLAEQACQVASREWRWGGAGRLRA